MTLVFLGLEGLENLALPFAWVWEEEGEARGEEAFGSEQWGRGGSSDCILEMTADM